MKLLEPEVAWYGGGYSYEPPQPPAVPDERHTFDKNAALTSRDPSVLKHVGLVMGRFRPPHLGHLHLIEEAFRQCGRLYVLIPAKRGAGGDLCNNLVTAAFGELATLHFAYDTEGFPRDASVPGFASAWAQHVREFIPNPITRVFSSDLVGAAIVAQELKAEHVVVDTKRERVPICASDIRADVFAGFRWLAPNARPWLALSVGLLGPECAGKTTLARELAAALRATVVDDGMRIEAAKHRGKLPWEMFASAIDSLPQRRCEAAMQCESGVVVVDDSRLLGELWARRIGHKLKGSRAAYAHVGDDEQFDVNLICHDDFGFVGMPERDHPQMRADMMREIVARTANRAIVVHVQGTDGRARVDTAVAAITAAIARRRDELSELLC